MSQAWGIRNPTCRLCQGCSDAFLRSLRSGKSPSSEYLLAVGIPEGTLYSELPSPQRLVHTSLRSAFTPTLPLKGSPPGSNPASESLPTVGIPEGLLTDLPATSLPTVRRSVFAALRQGGKE